MTIVLSIYEVSCYTVRDGWFKKIVRRYHFRHIGIQWMSSHSRGIPKRPVRKFEMGCLLDNSIWQSNKQVMTHNGTRNCIIVPYPERSTGLYDKSWEPIHGGHWSECSFDAVNVIVTHTGTTTIMNHNMELDTWANQFLYLPLPGFATQSTIYQWRSCRGSRLPTCIDCCPSDLIFNSRTNSKNWRIGYVNVSYILFALTYVWCFKPSQWELVIHWKRWTNAGPLCSF
jgi:hypothetical protein